MENYLKIGQYFLQKISSVDSDFFPKVHFQSLHKER